MYIFVDPQNRWIPLILILLWAILDYIDGCIARVTKTRSNYGHFIDVVGAYYFLAFFPICLGIGLYRFPENSLDSIIKIAGFPITINPALSLVLGGFTSLNNILLRLITIRMQLTFEIDPRSSKGDNSNVVNNVLNWIEALISPRGFLFPFMIAMTVVNKLELFIAFYFLSYSIALVVLVIRYSAKLKDF